MNGQGTIGAPISNKCEVCGAAATVRLHDIQEFSGRGEWAHHEPHSVHHFCESHQRPPRLYDGMGRVISWSR
jgi:hypothetical protein